MPAFPRVAGDLSASATQVQLTVTTFFVVDFAADAAGMTVAALVAARLAGRVPTRRVILAGQVADTAVPMALPMVGGAVLSMVGLLVLARGGTEPATTPR